MSSLPSPTNETIQNGILTYLANNYISYFDNNQLFTETRRSNLTDILEIVQRKNIPNYAINRKKWNTLDNNTSHREKSPNRFQCTNKETIKSILSDMVESGLLEYRNQDRMSSYFITRKGAESIDDTLLMEAFDKKMSVAAIRARTAKSAGSNAISMDEVKLVLGNVLGQKSPAAQQILSALDPDKKR